MTDHRDEEFGAPRPQKQDRPEWPDRDLGHADGSTEPPVAGAPVTTNWGEEQSRDPNLDRRRPTTAEQAVPWLIAVILLLVGMVIVLLALIFTSEDGRLAGADASPRPTSSIAPAAGVASPAPSPTPAPNPTPTPTPEATEAAQATEAAEATPDPDATPTPTPGPTYGPLEMVYLARSEILGPAWIYRRDFSTTDEPVSVAQAEQGVQRYAWAPDGTVGVAVISSRLVALQPGTAARSLGDAILTATFGHDSQTVYAVRLTQGGGEDTAEILEIDFPTGQTATLSTITYDSPASTGDSPLRAAQFEDEGGRVRLYLLDEGDLVLWVRAASTWQIDVESGQAEEIEDRPALWSPDGRRRVGMTDSGGASTLTLYDSAERPLATTSIEGLVSHLRWSPDSSQVVFTAGRSGSDGVRQDLYTWTLEDGAEPLPLTNNGASFGAEWLGAPQSWRR